MNFSTRFQRILFCLLLVLLPTQLGFHFWPQWAYINGIRVDYFAPTLYLTDLLVLGLFITQLVQVRLYKPRSYLNRRVIIGGLVLMVFVFLNSSSSLSPAVTIYKWLKVAEFAWLAYFIARHLSPPLSLQRLALLLSFSVVFESILAILQFLQQYSLGGIWYFLGERAFSSITPALALFVLPSGELLVRPYGTFSHPNVLAGFLVVVLPFLIYRFLHNSRRSTAANHLTMLAIILGYSTLFLTFSRAAILLGIAQIFFLIVNKIPGKIRLIAGGVVMLLLTLAFLLISKGSLFAGESFVARRELIGLSFASFTYSPFLGNGLGTAPLLTVLASPHFTNLALLFQPVHMIYLLLLSEVGILGLVAFLIILLYPVKILVSAGKIFPVVLSLVTILVLGLADHYFLTLQQGQLLLALVLGLAYREAKRIQ